MRRSPEDELRFAEALLHADRSNFSAWHYRSVLLPQVHAARGHMSVDELTAATESSAGPSTELGAGECAQDGMGRRDSEAAAQVGSGKAAEHANRVSRGSAASASSIPLYELKSEFDFVHQVRRQVMHVSRHGPAWPRA
jgi:hypothetical protein